MAEATLAGWALDAALLALRVGFGLCSFGHGRLKLGKVANFATHNKLPLWLANVAVFVQTVGSLMVVFGVFTQAAAAALFVFGLVATIILIRRGEPFVAMGQHSWDTGVVYTVIPFALMLLGGGAWSLDTLLFRP